MKLERRTCQDGFALSVGRLACFLTLFLSLSLSSLGLINLSMSEESLLPRSVLRTGSQFVRLTLATVEVRDLLGISGHDDSPYHGLLPTTISIFASVRNVYDGFGPVAWIPARESALVRATALSRTGESAPAWISTVTPLTKVAAGMRRLRFGRACQPASHNLCVIISAVQTISESGISANTSTDCLGMFLRSLTRFIVWLRLSDRGDFSLSNSRFASAARAFASEARTPASAIALSLASFSRLAVSVFSVVSRRFKRRACIPATAPTNASVAPIATNQNDIPSQDDAEDSSDIRLSVAFAVLFYGFVFMAMRARR